MLCHTPDDPALEEVIFGITECSGCVMDHAGLPAAGLKKCVGIMRGLLTFFLEFTADQQRKRDEGRWIVGNPRRVPCYTFGLYALGRGGGVGNYRGREVGEVLG